MNKQPHSLPDINRPLRVLIVRIGAMGDVLHAMPAVAALRQQHPDWFIGWVIDPCWEELLQAASAPVAAEGGPGRPLIDRCFRAQTREWKRRPLSLETFSEIRNLRRVLRQEKFDLCVDMQGSIRSSLIGWMAGAKRFIGSAAPRERPAGWMYGEQVKVNAEHVIEQGCELLGAAIGEPLAPAMVELPVDSAADSWRDEFLSRLVPSGAEITEKISPGSETSPQRIKPHSGEATYGTAEAVPLTQHNFSASSTALKFAVIAPSAGWGAKQWPAERYGAVAAELANAGYVPLVNAVVAGDLLANAVVDASNGTAVAVPCSVGQLIALTRRASIVIAGDTGPLHLAAALGRPVVALFGPTDPARNGPYGTLSRVLRHASSRKDHTRHAETEEGLMQISVDEVMRAAFDLLRSTG